MVCFICLQSNIKYLDQCYCYDDDLVTLPESPFAYFRSACFGKHNFDASLGFEQKDCSEPTLSCSSFYLQNKIGGFCLFWGSLTNKRYTILAYWPDYCQNYSRLHYNWKTIFKLQFFCCKNIVLVLFEEKGNVPNFCGWRVGQLVYLKDKE